MCIVDPTKAYDRPHTLLHEIAHAAGAVHNTSLSAGPGELMVAGGITADQSSRESSIAGSVLFLLVGAGTGSC